MNLVRIARASEPVIESRTGDAGTARFLAVALFALLPIAPLSSRRAIHGPGQTKCVRILRHHRWGSPAAEELRNSAPRHPSGFGLGMGEAESGQKMTLRSPSTPRIAGGMQRRDEGASLHGVRVDPLVSPLLIPGLHQ